VFTEPNVFEFIVTVDTTARDLTRAVDDRERTLFPQR
jgi:hypothetical protein